MSLDKRVSDSSNSPAPKIAMPKTELSAEEFIGMLEKLLSGESTGQEAAEEMKAKRSEIVANRNKLLGPHHQQ